MKLFLCILFFSLTYIASSQTEEKDTIISTVAEVDPAFPGGEDEMIKFINENFVYPKEARLNNEQGTVYVEFVVYNDGSIGNVHILKGVSKSIDAEAIRVVKAMPKWSPGIQDGKKVHVRYVIPIRVMLTTNKKKKRIFKR